MHCIPIVKLAIGIVYFIFYRKQMFILYGHLIANMGQMQRRPVLDSMVLPELPPLQIIQDDPVSALARSGAVDHALRAVRLTNLRDYAIQGLILRNPDEKTVISREVTSYSGRLGGYRTDYREGLGSRINRFFRDLSR